MKKLYILALLLVPTTTWGSEMNPYKMPSDPSIVWINPYLPTPCEGSWDGIGQTSCEKLGEPGVIGAQVDFAQFSLYMAHLWAITARPNGTLAREDGRIMYSNGYDVFNSQDHWQQFAFWEDEQRLIIGVEDLRGPSDWDYNDFVVELRRVPQNVPEPTALMMFGAALLAAVRRFFKREIS